MKVTVIFKIKTLKEETVDVSKKIRVFVNNVVGQKKVLSNVKRKYKKENIYIGYNQLKLMSDLQFR